MSDFKDWTALDKVLANAATRASSALLDIEQAHEAVILDYTRLREQVAALEADKAALTTVLRECETMMMIVAPRSHKDEYLATLSAVRLNLAAHGTKP